MSDAEQVRKKRFVQEFANERERDLRTSGRVSRKAARLKDNLARAVSGKPTIDHLRDPDRDELIFKRIKAAVLSGDVVRLSRVGGDAVTDMREHKRRKRQKETIGEELIVTGETTFWTPHWDHAGDRLKALSWTHLMHRNGGHAMTLHLAASVIEAAKASDLGFAAYMRDRVARYLRRAVGPLGIDTPEFFFSVEAARGVSPHLHGVVMVPDHSRGLDLAKDALERAGGPWEPRHLRLRLTPLTTPTKWVQYVSKWREGTSEFLGDRNVVAATSGLRRRARQWYEQARKTGSPL